MTDEDDAWHQIADGLTDMMIRLAGGRPARLASLVECGLISQARADELAVVPVAARGEPRIDAVPFPRRPPQGICVPLRKPSSGGSVGGTLDRGSGSKPLDGPGTGRIGSRKGRVA